MVDASHIRSRPPERRGQKDLLLHLLSLFGVCSAVIIVTALVLITMAQPSTLSRMNAFNVSHWWDPTLLRYLFYVLIMGLVVSTIGIAINMKRLFGLEITQMKLK